MFGDIAKNVGNFFGSFFNRKDDDEERRRREEAARQKREQAQQQKQQKQVTRNTLTQTPSMNRPSAQATQQPTNQQKPTTLSQDIFKVPGSEEREAKEKERAAIIESIRKTGKVPQQPVIKKQILSKQDMENAIKAGIKARDEDVNGTALERRVEHAQKFNGGFDILGVARGTAVIPETMVRSAIQAVTGKDMSLDTKKLRADDPRRVIYGRDGVQTYQRQGQEAEKVLNDMGVDKKDTKYVAPVAALGLVGLDTPVGKMFKSASKAIKSGAEGGSKLVKDTIDAVLGEERKKAGRDLSDDEIKSITSQVQKETADEAKKPDVPEIDTKPNELTPIRELDEPQLTPIADRMTEAPKATDPKQPLINEFGRTDETIDRLNSENLELTKSNPNYVQAEDGSVVDKTTGEVIRESPAKQLRELLEKQQTEQRAARASVDEANEKQQVTPDEPLQPTAPTETPRRGNAAEGLMERIQARREAFNQNQDEALARAAAESKVNREAGYDPTPFNPAVIQQRLQELGVDNAAVAAFAKEGATLSRINQILLGVPDWSKIQNPTGYIRNALRNVEQQFPTKRPVTANTLVNRQPEPAQPEDFQSAYDKLQDEFFSYDDMDEAINDIDGTPLEKAAMDAADRDGFYLFYDENWGGYQLALKDDITDIQDAADRVVAMGKKVRMDLKKNPDGTIPLYHGTKPEAADAILKGGFESGMTYLTPSLDVNYNGVNGARYYGDTVLAVDADPRKLVINPSGEMYIDSMNGDMSGIVRVQAMPNPAANPVEDLSRTATNSLQNDTTGMKPNGVERSGGFVENGTAKPVEVRTLEDGSRIIVDGRHTLEYARQNGITDFPIKDVTDQYTTPPKPGERTTTIANENIPFAEKRQRADELGQSLYDEIDAELQSVGSSFENLARQIAEANRGIRTDIDEVLKPIYAKLRAELDAAYNFRKSSTPDKDGRKTDQFGDQGQFYLPQARTGQSEKTVNGSFLDEFDDDGFVLERSDAIDINDLDTSAEPIKRYFREMLTAQNKTEKMAEKIVEEAAAKGKRIDLGEAMKAAEAYQNLADRINETAKLSKIIGVGRTLANTFRSSTDKLDRDVRKLPIVDELNKIGEASGEPITVVSDRIQGLTQWEKMRSVQMPDGRTLADEGYQQYRRTHAHAVTAMDIARTNGQPEFDTVAADLERMYPNMGEADMRKMQEYLGVKLMNVDKSAEANKLSIEDRNINATAAVESVYRKAALTNMVNTLKRTKFADKNTLEEINDAVAPMLVAGRINRSFAEAMSQSVAGWLNAGLRGYNIKSALVELTETHRVPTAYGIGSLKEFYTGLTPQTMNEIIGRYGVQDARSTASAFVEQNATVFQRLGNAMETNKVGAGVKTVADPMVLIKATSMYKHAATLRAAENFYMSKGLRGQELTDKVMDDFRQLMLPSDAQSRMNLNKNPLSNLLLQYWGWNIRNLHQDWKFSTGKSDVGVFADKDAAEAARRYIPAALAQKTAWWLGLNTVAGTTAATAYGLFDPFGVLQPDYSEIPEEERTLVDRAVKYTAISPISSMLSQLYMGIREEQERAEAVREGEYAPGDKENPEFSWENVRKSQQRTINNLMPGGNQILNYTKDFLDNAGEGVVKSDDGRVRYQTPVEGSLDWLRGALFGKGATEGARDYADSTDFLNDNPLEAASKDTLIDNLFDTREYNRPLASSSYDKGYNEQALEAYAAAEAQYGKNSAEARQVMGEWIKIGRDYNKVYDNFKKNDPANFERWVATMGDDVLTPEKWQIYQGNPDVFEFMKKRKGLEQRDLGRPIDPVYKIDSEQAKLVLQQRAAYTGDDMRLQEFLYKQPWYKDFKAQEAAYYDTFSGDREKNLEGKSQRVVDWNNLSTMLYEASDRYELVKQQKEITEKYGFGSPESQAWFDANKEAYMAQKQYYDAYRFNIVNEMRKLEGVAPLTEEEWLAKIEFPEEKIAGKGGKGGWSSWNSGERNNDRNKINFVYDNAEYDRSPRNNKSGAVTKDSLAIRTNAGSRSAGRRITLGGRSSGRVKDPEF